MNKGASQAIVNHNRNNSSTYRILPIEPVFTSQVLDHCIPNLFQRNKKGSGCAVGNDP